MITRGNLLHSVIQQLDLKQILSETDSPYFVPEEVNKIIFFRIYFTFNF
jgi:Tat protein secretion system quality control protein TatD with DNase activity